MLFVLCPSPAVLRSEKKGCTQVHLNRLTRAQHKDEQREQHDPGLQPLTFVNTHRKDAASCSRLGSLLIALCHAHAACHSVLLFFPLRSPLYPLALLLVIRCTRHVCALLFEEVDAVPAQPNSWIKEQPNDEQRE